MSGCLNEKSTIKCTTENTSLEHNIGSHENIRDENDVHDKKNNFNAGTNAQTSDEQYWLDCKETLFNPDVTLTFNRDDILVRSIKPHDVKKLLINKYGNRSSKIDSKSLHEIVIKKHDSIRERFKSEFRSSFENISVQVAIELGMRDGRSLFNYGHISKHVLNKPTFSTICRMQFLLRGVFSNQVCWKQKMEKN